MGLEGRCIGHIRIDAKLGSGGMGEVYRGTDEKLQRTVAVKVLRADRRLDAAARHRFAREARILSQLDHPGICRVHDLIEEEDADFLILEHIEGSTLRAEMERGIDPGQALSIAIQVAQALAAAHEQHVVHRDLKPENVMRTLGGTVKVLDFGIARSIRGGIQIVEAQRESGGAEPQHAMSPTATSTHDLEPQLLVDDPAQLFQSASPDLAAAQPEASPIASAADEHPLLLTTLATPTGALIGTVRYMSPEQAARGRVTIASDMYSFGIMLQEMLTGCSAYGDVAGRDLLLRVFRAQTVTPAGLEPGLQALIEELLRVDPEARPSAAETAERLHRHQDEPRRRRRRRLRIAAALAVAAALAISAGITAATRLQASRETARAQSLSKTAADIEWLLRAEHLSPTHDTRPAIGHVREETLQLEAMLGHGSDRINATIHTALGRAALALGEPAPARAHLEQALALDPASADAHQALALTLVALYRDRLRSLQSVPSGELRQRERERIDLELRQPAIAHLKAGRAGSAGRARGDGGTIGLGEPAHAAALLAYLEGRIDEAQTMARTHLGSRPWHYESDLLRGDIILDQARRLADRGEYEQARTRYDAAAERYQAAAAVGASDPLTHESLCSLYVERIYTSLYGKIEMTASVREAAAAACARALEADPERPGPHILLARSDQLWAMRSMRRGEPPDPWLETSRGHARAAVALDPESAEAHSTLGLVAQLAGEHAVSRGMDPTEALSTAIDELELASSLSPGPVLLNNLGFTHCQLAFWRLDRGEDPLPALARAISSFTEAIALDATSSMIHHNLGLAYQTRGLWQQDAGIDPTKSYGLAVDAYEAARSINPRRPLTLTGLGFVRVAQAEYVLDQGQDPAPLLDAAEAGLIEALDINPADLLAFTNLGSVWLIRGRARIEHGEDPGQELAAARQWYERSLELHPGWIPALGNILVVLRDTARYEALAGQSPSATVEDARRVLARAIAINPSLINLYFETAEIYLWQARFLHDTGRSPDAALGRAGELVTSGQAISQGSRPLHLVAARIDLLRAQAKLDRRLDPTLELAAARAHLEPDSPADRAGPTARELEARAELELLVATAARWQGHPTGSHLSGEPIARGLAAAEKALSMNPRLAGAEALRARLLILKGQGPATPAAKQALADGCVAIASAVHLSPLLAQQLEDLAASIRCEAISLPARSPTPQGASSGIPSPDSA